MRETGMKQLVLAAAVAIAVANVACATRPDVNIPATPPAVKSALDAADVVFADVEGDPARFRKQALAVLPALRDAVGGWSDQAATITARQVIEGWSLEIGMLETRIGALPERPDFEACKPVLETWQALRKRLP